jgi:predicted anti-sigma-YlaC factor YlaD
MRHPSRDLARYCDGQLPEAEAAAIADHLATCETCRRAHDQILFAASLLRQLPLQKAPHSIATLLDRGSTAAIRPRQRGAMPGWPLAVAALLLLSLGVAALYLRVASRSEGPWVIVSDGGAGTVLRKAAGDTVDTTQNAATRILVGTIGTVDVEPGSRVILGQASATTYQLSLERGTINADINAPPRMFIVDTPANTVVDLGCAYTVTVSLDGATELRMTSGWASLESHGAETLVPAGAMSRTAKGRRPGMPYFEDASPVFRRATDAFDAGDASPQTVQMMLNNARVRDTLTLWHLLSRVEASQRPSVFDRLQELVPLPAGVSRDRVMELDKEALRAWRLELAWHW